MRVEQSRRTESEAKYQAMVEQVPAVAYTWDPAHEPGTVPATYISPQIERLLGFTTQQWIEDPSCGAARSTTATSTACSRPGTRRSRRAIGSRWSTASTLRPARTVGPPRGKPVYGRDGTRYRGVLYDVTSEHETQQALRALEERFRRLVEQTPGITYIEDAATEETLYISPQVEDVYGYV